MPRKGISSFSLHGITSFLKDTEEERKTVKKGGRKGSREGGKEGRWAQETKTAEWSIRIYAKLAVFISERWYYG